MDIVLDKVEQELTGLVDDISRYEHVEERAERIIALDRDTVSALKDLQQHYEACRQLQDLRLQSQRLDKAIEQTLVGLAECRKQLESGTKFNDMGPSVDVNEVLNYATKITKFTHKQPGAEAALPWPTEDGIRRGLIAQLAATQEPSKLLQASQEDVPMADAEPEHEQPKQHQPMVSTKPQKINLDLFDSDED